MFYNTNLNAALIQDLEPDIITLIKLYIYLGTQFDGVLSTSQAAKSFMGTGLLTLVIFSDFTFSVILKEHYVFGHWTLWMGRTWTQHTVNTPISPPFWSNTNFQCSSSRINENASNVWQIASPDSRQETKWLFFDKSARGTRGGVGSCCWLVGLLFQPMGRCAHSTLFGALKWSSNLFVFLSVWNRQNCQTCTSTVFTVYYYLKRLVDFSLIISSEFYVLLYYINIQVKTEGWIRT